MLNCDSKHCCLVRDNGSARICFVKRNTNWYSKLQKHKYFRNRTLYSFYSDLRYKFCWWFLPTIWALSGLFVLPPVGAKESWTMAEGNAQRVVWQTGAQKKTSINTNQAHPPLKSRVRSKGQQMGVGGGKFKGAVAVAKQRAYPLLTAQVKAPE